MLSDSPPERDVIWTEDGVQAAGKFVQRVFRLVEGLAGLAAPPDMQAPAEFSAAATEVRKAAHAALIRVEEDIEPPAVQSCDRANL